MTCTRKLWKLLGLLPLLVAPIAQAASSDALLVADDGPSPSRDGPGCARTIEALGDRLQKLGLAVHSLIAPSPTSLRNALDAFADRTGGTPASTDMIYVCAPAVAEQSRLFIVPSATGTTAPADVQTQGILLQALVNALARTGGTLYADLRTNGDLAGEHRPRLPASVHLALNEDARNHPHRLGTALSIPDFPFDGNWTTMAAALGSGLNGLTIAPAPSPSEPLPDGLPPTAPLPAAAPPPATVTARSPPPQQLLEKHKLQVRPAASPVSPRASESRSWHSRSASAPQQADVAPSSRTARIEAALARHGAYAGPIDGKYTLAVIEAVQGFQRRLGDPATGVLTQAEIIRLLNP